MTFDDLHAARSAPVGRAALCVLFLALSVALLALPACTRSPEAEPDPNPPAEAGPPPAPEGSLRLATFNTEFLFDGIDGEGRVDFGRSGNRDAAQAHLLRVAGLIRTLDADAVMLQEVENESVLRQLAQSEPLAGLGYRAHFVQGTDTFTGQDVGLLSRLPVEEAGRTDERARVGGSDDDYGVSKNLYVRLRWQEVPVTLIGVHFLARPDDASRRDKREAQAEVIRRLVVREQAAGRAPVVLGDFNDFDVETPDVAGSRPITGVLQTIKRAGPGPEDNLRSVMPHVPQPQRYTAFYDRDRDDEVDGTSELSAIDHMLVPPALAPHLRRVRYVHEHDPVRGPDHFPIVATFAPAGDGPPAEAATDGAGTRE